MKIKLILICLVHLATSTFSQSIEMRKFEVIETSRNNKAAIEFLHTFVINEKKDIPIECYLKVQYKGERRFVAHKSLSSNICYLKKKLNPTFESSLWRDLKYLLYFEDIDLDRNPANLTAFIGVKDIGNFWVDFQISYEGIRNLAILSFSNNSLYHGAGDKIADYISEEIMKQNNYKVFDRMDLVRLMHENQIYNNYISDYDAVRIGKLANVDAVITGNIYEYGIEKIDDRIIKGNYYIGRYVQKEAVVQLSFKVIDIKSQKIIITQNIVGKALTEGFTDYDQINDITLNKYSFNSVRDQWNRGNNTDKTLIILSGLLESSEKNKELETFKTRLSSDFDVLSVAEKNAIDKLKKLLNFSPLKYNVSKLDYSNATGKKP
ncbi:MAG: CsgG/HfaB family protein [Bacteroidales bacterium]|nr:CsgG/HfaB family protein [Bacteroidales bacterium]